MLRRIFLFTLVCVVLLSMVSVTAFAAETPLCDEGPVQDVTIRLPFDFKGQGWYERPDSRIDGKPIITLLRATRIPRVPLGPFKIRANITDTSIASATAFFSAEHGDWSWQADYPLKVDMSKMTISSNRILTFWENSGDLGEDIFIRVHFYIEVYDQDGNLIWLDEIPYTCPPDDYTHGDPYNFLFGLASRR